LKFIQAKAFELLAAIGDVASVVPRKATIPVLTNILIRRTGGGVEFVGSDLEAQMTASAALGGDAGTYSTTLNAKKLTDILRTLPADQVVTLEESAGKTVLKSGRSKFTLQALPAEDFPLVQESADFGETVEIDAKALKSAIDRIGYAMAVQDVRYYLVGMLCVLESGKMTTVATDGHRLAMTEIDVPGERNRQEVIVPRKAVLELHKLIKGASKVLVRFAANQARFTVDGVEFVTKLVEGKFPDYNRVIPKMNNQLVTLSRLEALSSLQRVSLMTSEKFRGLKMSVAPGSLGLTASSVGGEDAAEEITTEYAGPAFEVGFNAAYLTEALSTMDQSLVTLAFRDASGAVLITRPDCDKFRAVVMPMRI